MTETSTDLRLLFFPEAEARLVKPVMAEQGKETVEFFIQSCYVRARDEKEALEYLIDHISANGAVLLTPGAAIHRRETELESAVRARIGNNRAAGVVWCSGRVFYNPDQ
jgi:hypothetical protein